MTATLHVALEGRGYDILVGQGLLARAGELMKPLLARPRVIVVADARVAALYGEALAKSLAAAGIAHAQVTVPSGEGSKSFAGFETLMNALLDVKPDRKTTLVALGGGVAGDLTGFAASTLLRGVDFVQIPTTLLAQVDSSVGGKTGINSRHGKNLIGSFYQPRLVIADTDVLATLPRRERLAGYAEIVKYGVIRDAEFFRWLEANGPKALEGDAAAIAHAVRHSCAMKAEIVAQDEREAGLRALLNFGHTLGHALEAETGFSDRLLHGEAVAVGMVLALRLSRRRGLVDDASCARLESHLRAVGLPALPRDVRPDWDRAALIRHCYQDKKAQDGKLTFILARAIGDSYVEHDVHEDELKALLAEAA